MTQTNQTCQTHCKRKRGLGSCTCLRQSCGRSACSQSSRSPHRHLFCDFAERRNRNTKQFAYEQQPDKQRPFPSNRSSYRAWHIRRCSQPHRLLHNFFMRKRMKKQDYFDELLEPHRTAYKAEPAKCDKKRELDLNQNKLLYQASYHHAESQYNSTMQTCLGLGTLATGYVNRRGEAFAVSRRGGVGFSCLALAVALPPPLSR